MKMHVRDIIKKKDKCVIALIMFYEIKGGETIKVYSVLSCVPYLLIDNYVCIYNVSCQSKILSRISSHEIFEKQFIIY